LAKQKNILFISYDGMTDPLGQSQVIPYLQGLSAIGYNIYLLSCEKKGVFKNNQQAVSQILKDAGIHWITLPYSKKPPVLSTLLDIYKLKKAAQKIHQLNRIDLVHTRPGIPALVGLWLKNKFGIKFLNDIREFYADSRVEGGMWDTRKVLYKKVYEYFKKQEIAQVQNSDGIVCLTHAAEKIIKQWPEYNKSIPVSVIPCSVDIDLFDPEKLNKAIVLKYREPLHIQPGDFVISYLGSIGGWYLTDEMMRFCKMVSEKIPQAKFLFISPHRHDQIVNAALKFNLPADKIITTHAKRKEVPALLSLSNYSLFFIKPCYSKLSSSPTKLGEIMAMGIPVITNSGVGDVKDIVEKYNAGIIVDGFSNADFEIAIQTLMNHHYDAVQIRNAAINFYNLQTAIEKYNIIYSQILSH
jgi:glycosyltransferase involved in cell wall biosynthesis